MQHQLDSATLLLDIDCCIHTCNGGARLAASVLTSPMIAFSKPGAVLRTRTQRLVARMHGRATCVLLLVDATCKHQQPISRTLQLNCIC